jgi:hypothetical protein
MRPINIVTRLILIGLEQDRDSRHDFCYPAAAAMNWWLFWMPASCTCSEDGQRKKSRGITVHRPAKSGWTLANVSSVIATGLISLGGLISGATPAVASPSSISPGYCEGSGFCNKVVTAGYDLGNGGTSFDNIYPCGPEPGTSFPSYGDLFQTLGRLAVHGAGKQGLVRYMGVAARFRVLTGWCELRRDRSR